MVNQTKFFSPATFRLKRKALMLVVLLGLLATEMAVGTGFLINRPYLLALPFVPFLFLGFSSRLDYGIVVVLFCMVAVRIGVSTGTASKIPVSLIIAGLWMATQLIKMALERNIRFVRSGINLPIIIFICIVLVSTLWSRFLLDPQVIIDGKFLNVQLGTIGFTVISVLVTVMCANLVRQVEIVKKCYWIFLGGSLFYLPFYIYETVLAGSSVSKIGPDEITIQTLSRLVNAGGLFPMWFCALTLALLLNTRDLGKWQRFFMVVALLGWLFRLFVITLVRISGWLPALVAMLILLFLYSRKWFSFMVIVATILCVLNFPLIYSATVGAKEQEGTLSGETSRGSLLQQALQVAKDHPILGTGPAGYANYYITYFRELALSTHNNYLDMLLQYGLLGLCTFIWICLALIKELWKSSRLHPRGSFERAFTLGAFAGVCGMMPAMWLGDWAIPFAYNQTISGFNYTGYNWVFPGLALALGYIARERQCQVTGDGDQVTGDGKSVGTQRPSPDTPPPSPITRHLP
jgi:O-antigen ligase